jgi:hypothetical protein
MEFPIVTVGCNNQLKSLDLNQGLRLIDDILISIVWSKMNESDLITVWNLEQKIWIRIYVDEYEGEVTEKW